jgi:hypothetical protein
MLKLLKQARAAFSLLSADEVRKRADKPVHFGLVADSSGAYAEMEAFLLPDDLPREERPQRILQIHRASDTEPPGKWTSCCMSRGSRVLMERSRHRGDPARTVAEILVGEG